MKNPNAARRIAKRAIRMGKSPEFIIEYLKERYQATDEEAKETVAWAQRIEGK